jgi:carbamoyl-phosphate synthase/aspartate carbamoyltransferase/dihydroorotase
MPNNPTPITTAERVEEKINIAKQKTVCDIGFYFGSLGDNLEEFNKVKNKVFGIKLYLNHTTGDFIVNKDVLENVYRSWESQQPILTHSEEDVIGEVMLAVKKHGKQTHVCHVSSQVELEYVIKAKEDGLPVTCGVCPHHLFLTEDDVKMLGGYGKMKPPLKSKKDVEFLWNNLKYIDVIESDHAPHTREEKEAEKPTYGVPGLETTLPLLLRAEKEGRLAIDDIVKRCYENPLKILHLAEDKETHIEVSLEEYTLENSMLHTKCGWSPFEGMKMGGKVESVTLHGREVYRSGKLLSQPGSGTVLTPLN